jgi:hypothetical protein
MSASKDLVLYASFLQNKQQEQSNRNFRLVQDLFTGKGDVSLLTKNLELSLTELKNAQLDDLRELWSNTVYPSLTVADFIKYHNVYTEELIDLENRRLLSNSTYLSNEKAAAGVNHADVTADSLGLNNTRRPPKKLPPTHIITETGATFGIDPCDGTTKAQPLLYGNPIKDLREINDVLIYLPSTLIVDFQPSLKNIIIRGRLLGFGERHFDACFKLFVYRFFPQYSSIFMNGITASETFNNILTVFRSHDVVTILKDTLKNLNRESSQSFTEFGTILKELATRVVSETHLQMTLTESREFAEDKLLTFVTTFTSDQVRKLFETEKSTALRTNEKFYSFDGAMISIYEIEIFVKPPATKYAVPIELYNALTNDTSLQSSVMLQALSILNIKSQATEPVSAPPSENTSHQINATDFRSYNNEKDGSNRNQSSSYSRNMRDNKPPYKSNDTNPRYTSPNQRDRTPSRERGWKPQEQQSRDAQSRSEERVQNGRQGRSNDKQTGGKPEYRGKSNSRADQYRTPSRSTTPNRQQQQGRGKQYQNDQRTRSRSQNNDNSSRDRPATLQQHSRNNSGNRQGKQPFQRQQSKERERSISGGRQNTFNDRSRSQDKKGASRQQSRSQSRDRPKFCPYCGGSGCLLSECNIFDKREMSFYPCALCPDILLHRTSAHNKIN